MTCEECGCNKYGFCDKYGILITDSSKEYDCCEEITEDRSDVHEKCLAV